MRPTVLIVDDHDAFRSSARALLQSEGFDVVGEAMDGREAVEAVALLRPDVVLLDIQLPGEDGIAVAERLTTSSDPPAVVLISSRDVAAYGPRQLGTTLLARLAGHEHADLVACLADTIVHVRGLHGRTCDLSHAGTPSATVLAAKQTATTLDYLVLADSVLALDRDGEVQVVTDQREAQAGRELRRHMDSIAGGTSEHAAAHRDYVERLRALRNREGGFWVASAEPEAAAEAVTGSVLRAEVRAAALLSDGASRLQKLVEWGDIRWRRVL